VTPIWGGFFGSVCRGATTDGAVESVGLGLAVGLGGAVSVVGGVVSGAADEVVVSVGSTVLAGPLELRSTSRTADTRSAINAIPIAPRAAIAAVVRYQGTTDCW